MLSPVPGGTLAWSLPTHHCLAPQQAPQATEEIHLLVKDLEQGPLAVLQQTPEIHALCFTSGHLQSPKSIPSTSGLVFPLVSRATDQ